MKNARLFSIALMPWVAACVSTNVDVPRDHPANPSAPVTRVALAGALVSTPPRAEPAAPAEHHHAHHQHGGHEQHEPTPASSGNAAAPPAPPAQPAAPAAPSAHAASPAAPRAPAAAPAAPSKQADKPAAEAWTCPMHPEVVKSGPGQCPICGMNLVKRDAGKAK